MELTLYPSFTYRMPSLSATIHGERGRHDLIVKVQCGNNYYYPCHVDEKSGAMSNGSDGPKQTDSEGRTFIPSRASRIAYTGQSPRELVEMRIQMGFCRSRVEPSSPIFNVLTAILLRVMAYIFTSSKEPSYPSPYIDSILRAVTSKKSSLPSVNNAFLESTKEREKTQCYVNIKLVNEF